MRLAALADQALEGFKNGVFVRMASLRGFQQKRTLPPQSLFGGLARDFNEYSAMALSQRVQQDAPQERNEIEWNTRLLGPEPFPTDADTQRVRDFNRALAARIDSQKSVRGRSLSASRDGDGVDRDDVLFARRFRNEWLADALGHMEQLRVAYRVYRAAAAIKPSYEVAFRVFFVSNDKFFCRSLSLLRV